jgi:hypothetical protein
MTALFRIEAWHLARSPLLWIGMVAAALLLILELNAVWPALAGDDLIAYRDGVAVGAGALLAGAWLGLRDQATGAVELVAVTPVAPWRLWRARLASVAVVAAAAFAALFGAGLAYSAARGGRGTADLRLLADGALGVVLGGWVGLAVGRRSGSLLVPLLVAPLWIAVSFFGPLVAGGLAAPVQRLSPLLAWERHSAAFGFLPDAVWPHLGYLLGLVVVVGVLVTAGRDRAQRAPMGSLLVVGVAGLVLVGASAARLVVLPDRLVAVGPADLEPASPPDLRLDRPLTPYPDDGRARACTGDKTLAVCVYPAYGRELAGYVRGAMAPEAELLAGLPGAPTQVRMVPTDGLLGYCQGTEVTVTEWMARASPRGRQTRILYAQQYLRCALGAGSTDNVEYDDARDAVGLWALLATGKLTRAEMHRATEGGPGPIALLVPQSAVGAAAALAMAELPPDRVRAELAPVWARLRAGTLPVSELPGRRP